MFRRRLFRFRPPMVGPLPLRVPLPIEESQLLEVVMHEYDATRAEIQSSRSNQVSGLSFGAATVGFLVAGAAQLWGEAAVLASLLFLLAVPAMCFLTLATYFAELIRIMRASLFLHELENSLNESVWSMKRSDETRVLIWEQWSIREGWDIGRHGGLLTPLIFTMLALGFMTAGYLRLHDPRN